MNGFYYHVYGLPIILIGELIPSLHLEIGCGVDLESSLSITMKLVFTPPTLAEEECMGNITKAKHYQHLLGRSDVYISSGSSHRSSSEYEVAKNTFVLVLDLVLLATASP